MRSSYIGETFNELKVIDSYRKRTGKGGYTCFVCECQSCGKTIDRSAATVLKGKARCECSYQRGRHGDSKKGRRTRLYVIYNMMKSRCYYPKNTRYKNYGAKGIRVCQEWLGKNGYESFKKWAIENGYNDGLSIDRIDNEKDYEPSNCRWVDSFVQMNNTTRNHFITHNGKTLTLTQWERELGMSHGVLQQRLNKLGWSEEEALTKPVRKLERKEL